MSTIITQIYQSPVGELLLGVYQDQLCLCDWRYRKMRDSIDQRICRLLSAQYQPGEHPLLNQTIEQFKQYFTQQRKQFDLPLLLAGTDFQRQVWLQLLQVEYGQTISYLGLSEQMNKPDAVRAVANANGANAISIIVPCHRVIGSNGELTGYAGGINVKQKLLNLEQDLFAS